MNTRISVDSIVLWGVFILTGFAAVATVTILPLAIHDREVRDDVEKRWCGDHGYSVAGISQTTSSGKISTRIDQVICLDDQRRMIFPGE